MKRKLLFGLTGVVSAYVPVTTIATCLSIHYQSIYMDQWEILSSYFRFIDENRFFTWLFAFHNEHQIVIARLFHLADWKWFGATNLFLVICILLTQALYAVFFYRILRRARVSVWASLTVIAWTLIFLFSCSQFDNLGYGFQISFVQVYLFSFLSILLFVDFLVTKKKWQLICGFLFAIMASYSMANGMLVWPILVFIALVARAWKSAIGFGLFCIFFFYNYLSYKAASPQGGSILESLHSWHDVLNAIRYGFVYLGNPLGSVSLTYATVYAAILVGYFVFLAWIVYIYRKQVSHLVIALLIVSLFILCTALVTTLGRFEMGIFQATSGRYTTPAVLLSCFLILATVIMIQQKMLKNAFRIVMGLWLLAAVVFTGYMANSQRRWISYYHKDYINKQLALSAIQNDTLNLMNSLELHPLLGLHLGTIKFLKADSVFGKILNFKAPDDHKILPPETPPIEVTTVHFLETTSLDGSRPAYIVYGGLKIDPNHLGDKLYLADSVGRWVGSGYVIDWLPQFWPLTDFKPEGANLFFFAHLNVSKLDPNYRLYVEEGKALSEIGNLDTSIVESFLCRLLSFRQYRGVVSQYEVVSRDPAWMEKGSYDGVPQYKQIAVNWGTWKAGDEATGELRLRIPDFAGHTELNVPYLSGPAIPMGHLMVIDNRTGEVISEARPGPYWAHWMVIQFKLPEGLESIDLIVREEGTRTGEWMGIGPPAIN